MSTPPTAVRTILIVGTGGHAKVVADIVRANNIAVGAFVDELKEEVDGGEFLGVSVFGGATGLQRARIAGFEHAIPAFGDCEARLACCERLRANGFLLATAIHPRSIVAAHVAIGSGSVIVAGAVINPGASVGEAVIVNTSSSVDHDGTLEDGVHVEPGARLAGSVRVGRGTTIGIGAVITKGLRIGRNSHVGAGAVVTRDLPDDVVAYGNPARVVRRTASRPG